MLGLLLARKGMDVLVLEKHGDFLRDFRGDTIHPSTMEIMDELGLADRLLRLKHTKASQLRFRTPRGGATLADFRHLKTRFPYLAFMPQWDFLDFVTEEAERYPNFHLAMNAEVRELVEEDSVVTGVRYEAPDGTHEVWAPLTVAADGRDSRVREQAGLEVIGTAPPIDVLWFRLSRREGDPEEPTGYIGGGRFLILINRGDYWQLGYVLPKGADRQVRAAGLESFRRSIGEAVPEVADRTGEIRLGTGEAPVRPGEPSEALVPAGPLVHRRRRPRDVARGRSGDKPCDPGRRRRGERALWAATGGQGGAPVPEGGAAAARPANPGHPGAPGPGPSAGVGTGR
jgi:2-polyprenyl-6-methoxyphenol hydroxylase-like FAD-dependent oxidoreductase